MWYTVLKCTAYPVERPGISVEEHLEAGINGLDGFCLTHVGVILHGISQQGLQIYTLKSCHLNITKAVSYIIETLWLHYETNDYECHCLLFS